jgi:hypothetical protein
MRVINELRFRKIPIDVKAMINESTVYDLARPVSLMRRARRIRKGLALVAAAGINARDQVAS